MKRKDYISWDQYFMAVAKLSAMRSKDPHTQVGCCIVNPQNRIVSLGYNGFPIGINDDDFSWDRKNEKDPLATKYWYVCHAELNAIINAKGKDLYGCKLYVTHFPCNECAKAIIQSGIKEVIYEENPYPDTDITKASIRMLTAVGIKLTLYHSAKRKVEIIL